MKTIFSTSTTIENKENLPSIYDIQVNGLNNKPINLATFKGKNILFVNVASKCGFTNQYKELQELSDRYKDALVVIGVPCNQFGKQEPGDANAIQNFCKINYGVTFLITEKIEVKGKNVHPLYQWLTQEQKNGVHNTSVKWNFQKYLVNTKGELVDYYFSNTKPLSKKNNQAFMKLAKRIIFFLILNFGGLAFGGWLMNNGPQSQWYITLNQAPWTPPGWVFGAAWTTIMICFSMYLAYLFLNKDNVKLRLAFVFQLLLNVSWNYVFFNQHETAIGLAIIGALTVVVFTFFFSNYKDLKSKSYLILPYMIWILIATTLNAYILLNN